MTYMSAVQNKGMILGYAALSLALRASRDPYAWRDSVEKAGSAVLLALPLLVTLAVRRVRQTIEKAAE